MLARIGDKNGRLYQRVKSREVSAGRTVQAEIEKERSRIARELHSGAGQPLAGIILNLEMLNDGVDGLPAHAQDIVLRLQRLANQALDQVRAVSHRLYPPQWKGLPVEDALRNLVDSGIPADAYHVDLRIAAMPFEPAQFVKVALYRCAQECISNMLRHSRATRFALSLRLEGNEVEMEIRDNGCGFAGSGAPGGGIGIASLHEYARAAGGSCRISTGGSGTAVNIRIPLAED
jgi:signal transduction histidine kinase